MALFPRSDPDFVSSVYGSLIDGIDPAALRARLRETYPLVVVRRREISGERVEVWYVYRDGRWTPDSSFDGETRVSPRGLRRVDARRGSRDFSVAKAADR